MTKKLCILPFTQLSVDTNSNAKVCAYFDENNNLEPASIEEIDVFWKSSYMQSIRDLMLSGQKVEACSSCYRAEDLGHESYRLFFNKLYQSEFEEIVSNTDNPSIYDKPKRLELRASNTCNLKCRMCSPHFSHLIAKEVNDPYPVREITEELKQDLHEKIDYFEEISFLGGEPTIDKYSLDYIKHIIASNRSQEIKLVITTNATTLTKDLISDISKFKSCHFVLSIDGIDKLNEYIRYGSSWKIIEKNLEVLNQLSQINSQISSSTIMTVQNYNIFNIKEYLEYFSNYYSLDYSKIRLNVLDGPEHLSIYSLPKHIRKKSLEELSSININAEDSRLCGLDTIKKILAQNETEDSKAFQKFLFTATILDRLRKQQLKAVSPKLFFALFNK